MVAVWAGQGIALALGSCPGQAGARGSAAGRRPVPQGREALLRRGGPGRILQAAACPHAGDVRSVLMHIDRVPRRPCAVKTRKHPRSKLTNEIKGHMAARDVAGLRGAVAPRPGGVGPDQPRHVVDRTVPRQ